LPYHEGAGYDLVIVNIVAPVIVGMAPALAMSLKPGGYLVAAGLIESQELEVSKALADHGLGIVSRTTVKDWVGLEAQRG
jgi:ribosomal protein L11 methyltransferase